MALDVGLRSGLSSPLELSDPFWVVPQNLPFFIIIFFIFGENADAWKSKPFVETQCFK